MVEKKVPDQNSFSQRTNVWEAQGMFTFKERLHKMELIEIQNYFTILLGRTILTGEKNENVNPGAIT